jgi:hypothetical protein
MLKFFTGCSSVSNDALLSSIMVELMNVLNWLLSNQFMPLAVGTDRSVIAFHVRNLLAYSTQWDLFLHPNISTT